MKTYQVNITKAYAITVKAKNETHARRMCEFYTGDIDVIATAEEMKREKFHIEDIECTMNETFDCEKIKK